MMTWRTSGWEGITKSSDGASMEIFLESRKNDQYSLCA